MYKLIFLVAFTFEVTKSNPQLEIYKIINNYKDQLSPLKVFSNYKVNQINLTDSCKKQIDVSISRLKNETWAIQMIDAWGKFPEGLLSGHWAMMGDFAECMSLRGNFYNNENEIETIKGKYCPMHLILDMEEFELLTLKSSNRMSAQDTEDAPLYSFVTETELLLTSPTLAVCLPSSCTQSDFIKIFSPLAQLTDGAINPITSYCRVEDKPEYDAVVIAMMVVSAVLLLVTAVGSLVDLFYVQIRNIQQPSLRLQVLLAFSLPSNLEKLLSTNTSENNLGCLHGLRFLSMCWVVLGHTWSLIATTGLWNQFNIPKVLKPWPVLTVINGDFCVDSFFTMGGFLVAYQLLAGLEKSKGKFNPLIIFIHRYMRLTPTYIFLIGVIIAYLPLLSNGPMWSLIEMNAKYCRRNWWENLLYINNIPNRDTENDFTDVYCVGASWYLGCDMQFFVVSIFAVYLLWKFRKLGMLLLVLLTILPMATTGTILGIKNIAPIGLITREATGDEKGTTEDYYAKPWTRIGSYIAGIWGGYFYYLTKTSNFRLPNYAVKLGWLLSTVSALAILYGPVGFYNPEIPIPKVGSIAYGAFSRTAWGVVIAWIIYACVSGSGGIANKILSAKVFMPLARTSFCVYLISYELQQIFHARYPQPLALDTYLLTNLFLAHLSLSLLFGFGLTVLIESPFIQLEKLIFGKFR